jgi:hypothetical protein
MLHTETLWRAKEATRRNRFLHHIVPPIAVTPQGTVLCHRACDNSSGHAQPKEVPVNSCCSEFFIQDGGSLIIKKEGPDGVEEYGLACQAF